MSAVRWDDNEISDALALIRQGDLKWLVFEYDNKPLKMSTIRFQFCNKGSNNPDAITKPF